MSPGSGKGLKIKHTYGGFSYLGMLAVRVRTMSKIAYAHRE